MTTTDDAVLAFHSPHHGESYWVADIDETPDDREVQTDQCDRCGSWMSCSDDHPDAQEVAPGSWVRLVGMTWRPTRAGFPDGVVRCECGAEYRVERMPASQVVFP